MSANFYRSKPTIFKSRFFHTLKNWFSRWVPNSTALNLQFSRVDFSTPWKIRFTRQAQNSMGFMAVKFMLKSIFGPPYKTNKDGCQLGELNPQPHTISRQISTNYTILPTWNMTFIKNYKVVSKWQNSLWKVISQLFCS